MNDQIEKEAIVAASYIRGQAEGFKALYESYYNDIYFFTLNLTSDAELSRDLAHETFLKAYAEKDIASYKIKSWLFKVAANEFFSYKRSYYLKIRYFMKNIFKFIDEPVNAETEYINKTIAGENRSRLRECLKELTGEERSIISLKYYNDFSYREISETLGIEEGTVMSRLHRVKEKLKGMIDNERK